MKNSQKDENEVEQKNYKYIVQLKDAISYELNGETKKFTAYFCTEIKEGTLFPNSLELTIENQSGTRKVNISKDKINEVVEVL